MNKIVPIRAIKISKRSDKEINMPKRVYNSLLNGFYRWALPDKHWSKVTDSEREVASKYADNMMYLEKISMCDVSKISKFRGMGKKSMITLNKLLKENGLSMLDITKTIVKQALIAGLIHITSARNMCGNNNIKKDITKIDDLLTKLIKSYE